ncbi:MAG: gliding motility-associated protein GldE [Bacteroidota bacterium]|nr:gliding motility-associated protein GldE [Bacteroidota bacterium]
MEIEPLDPDPFLCFSSFVLSIIKEPLLFDFFLLIAVHLILLLFSAFISGSEIAYFSLSAKDITFFKHSKKVSERNIFTLLDKPKKLLATILIVNNLINISLIILFTLTINKYFDFSNYNKTLTFVFEIGLITLLLVLFGELIPKIYANQNNKRFAKFMSFPLLGLTPIFHPFSFLLVKGTNVIEKRIKKKEYSITAEEFNQAIDITAIKENNPDNKMILKRLVNFSNVYVKQIMISRVDVVAYDRETTFNYILEKIKNDKYSRVPVYKDNPDNIKGILYIKDLLPFFEKDNNFQWQKLLRKPFFIPENKKIDDLLKEFQNKKVHLAIVVDEYGGFSGIITLDDILEEIIGDITDELGDSIEDFYSKIDDKTLIFNAKTPITDFVKILNLPDNYFDKQKGDSETLAGLVIEILGKIPSEGENIKIANLLFVINAVDNKKIDKIKVILK